MSELLSKKCIPCEGGTLPLSPEQAAELHTQIPDWQIAEEGGMPKKITRSWKFADFAEALAFANKVGALAEEEGHHPDLLVSWGKVGVELSTHSIGGLSENDFIIAAKIDALS